MAKLQLVDIKNVNGLVERLNEKLTSTLNDKIKNYIFNMSLEEEFNGVMIILLEKKRFLLETSLYYFDRTGDYSIESRLISLETLNIVGSHLEFIDKDLNTVNYDADEVINYICIKNLDNKLY